MMHIDKLSRQVVLEHWRRELMLAEFPMQELVLAKYEHEFRDIIVGVLDELIEQLRVLSIQHQRAFFASRIYP